MPKPLPTIALFKCPVCGSPVQARGLMWKCTRPTCCFYLARRYKADPHGAFESQGTLERHWVEARASYQSEQSYPQPHIDRLTDILNDKHRFTPPKDVKWIKRRIEELEIAKKQQLPVTE